MTKESFYAFFPHDERGRPKSTCCLCVPDFLLAFRLGPESELLLRRAASARHASQRPVASANGTCRDPGGVFGKSRSAACSSDTALAPELPLARDWNTTCPLLRSRTCTSTC
jgi:hypothetical protein